MDKVFKEKVSQALGISVATLENWNKAGLIPPVEKDFAASLTENEGAFSKFIRQIQENTQDRLNSRANRTSSGKKITVYQGITDAARKKLLDALIEAGQTVSVEIAVLAAALRQLECSGLMTKGSRVERDIQKWIGKKFPEARETIFHLYDNFQIPNENDDILGALYQSLQSIGQKTGGGSFYTPANALGGIKVAQNQTVYDPCCGSGNILLHVLTKKHASNMVYASDIDELALLICEVNLVLFYNDADMKANLFVKSLIKTAEKNFPSVDIIITNPPWGARFSAAEKKALKQAYPELQTSESFSICLYNAFKLLKPKGQLYFFLPEAFLNVTAHIQIRKFILEQSGHLEIIPLGSVFKGVFSKTILLHFDRAGDVGKKGNFLLNQSDFSFSLVDSKDDVELLNRLYELPHITLKENAKFFLGIVTGDNEKYISTKPEKFSNPLPVYRGKNVRSFALVPSTPPEYIDFTPQSFQQCVAAETFSQKKIIYRFISDRPVCAISTNAEIILNSANAFIPACDYPWETIVSLFNSDLYAKVYKLRFNSVKILRSHLEQLPLPLLTKEQHEQIKSLYEQIQKKPDNQLFIQKMNSLISGFLD